MTRLRQAGFRWEADPDFAPHLGEALAGLARVVKESPAKQVSLHRAACGEFYVKRYRHTVEFWRPLKFLFKPSQARREWRLARRLAARGVPVVRHVALGERWTWRGLEESVLITEAFPGRPLDEAEGVDPAALLRFVGLLHDRGVLQRDLHPGNILRHETADEWRLVDLHGIELRKTISPKERASNLAFLHIHYPLPGPPEALAAGERLRRAYLARRSRRCLKHNREFAPERRGRLLWQTRLPWLNERVLGILEDPDGFLASGARLLKAGRSATVGLADGLVLKRYNFRKLFNPLKDLLRGSKARRAFHKAYHLELAGVPTARPIAAADDRRFGFPVRSYLLMEEIPGARSLDAWGGDPRHAAREAARLIARLHDEGFSHRDLKETNLVFDREGRLFLIDLEGLTFLGRVPPKRAAQDLRRLARAAAGIPACAPAIRRLFIRTYCRKRGLRPRALRGG
ncbi:MAG: hypothetical protein J7M29_12830 [Verrucomicrobia bacterium]|nr:hypothetical protein [Verrucomicrobiota bacterium]